MREQYIVCAANRFSNGYVVLGIRHWDTQMHQHTQALITSGLMKEDDTRPVEQGFVDQRGLFLTRREAWDIAVANGQVKYTGPGCSGPELYSENLY